MEQEEDRLSNLPKIILHNILSRLPEEDAARTSVLSKAWLEIWYTFPNLSFRESQFIGKSTQPVEDIVVIGTLPQPMEDLQKKRMDFSDYVKSRLARFLKQRLAIKEFKLSVNCFELGYMSRDVDLWLKLASESSVEVLELCNNPYKNEERRSDQCYVLPKSVIEAKSLSKLVLKGKIRVDQAFMNHSIKLFSLRELNLSNVHLEDEKAIEHLISHCPLIEIIIFMHFCGSMKSLSMHGLQKLKTVEIDGIKEVYIDDAPNLKKLFYCHENLHTPLKIDLVRCENLKELFVYLNSSTTIITNKWFLELFPKFIFLERLELLNCTTSEKINISSVQLKFLKLLNCYNLKEANIDAPNLSSCNFLFHCSEPHIVSFLRISSQLEILVEITIYDFDGCYLREVLQNIKPQNVLTSLTLSLYIFEPTVDAPMFLDISTPPPSIKHMDLRIPPMSEIPMSENLFPYLVDFLLLCCVPATISLSLNTSSRAFIEFFYERLMRRKDDDCFCSSNDTKCWWHNLKDVKVINSMKIDETIDLKTMLDLSPTFPAGGKISFMLIF